jgi:uncharacterized protein YPO0396
MSVPRSGLLITGGSGSGKSTLLDGLSAVLVHPKWLRFNAAAQDENVRDVRNIATYVRGGFTRQLDEETGAPAMVFLRPSDATWSAIALTYRDEAGHVTSLIRLMHLARGATRADDVKSAFVLAEEDVELLSLADYVRNGIDIRALKRAHEEWFADSSYSGFANRLRNRLGLSGELAQRLLHKTQSAKNLNSLDRLLRDYMLDEPQTFSLVRQAIDQFQELSEAHRSVVDARRQRDVLLPLANLGRDQVTLMAEIAALKKQLEHTESMSLELQLVKLDNELASLENSLNGLCREIEMGQQLVKEKQIASDAARDSYYHSGGQEVDAAERRLTETQESQRRVQAKRQQAITLAEGLELTLPELESQWEVFCDNLRSRQSSLEETTELSDTRYALADQAAVAKRELDQLCAELVSLERTKSNIPSDLLAVRSMLAEACDVQASDLPFAAELVGVRAAAVEWTGAIERVLRPFALTLLVPEELQVAVGEYVDSHNLQARLSYSVTVPHVHHERAVDLRLLPRKLEVADGEFHDWVVTELEARYSYLCVDSVVELRDVTRGVTRAGQIKHSQIRHEKDDRKRVDDRRSWMLGSSIAARQAALSNAISVSEAAVKAAEERRDLADRAMRDRYLQREKCGQLIAIEWEDIDIVSVTIIVEDAQKRLAVLRASGDLETARLRYEENKQAYDQADGELRKLEIRHEGKIEKVQELKTEQSKCQAELHERVSIPEAVRETLLTRFAAAQNDVRKVDNTLNTELNGKSTSLVKAHSRIRECMSTYQRDWPTFSANLGTDESYLDEYLALLRQVQTDRLPEFEQQFFDLLQTQSRKNISLIANELRKSGREIRDRISPINTSLRQTPFNPDRYLQIKVVDRNLAEVKDFRQVLLEITNNQFEDFTPALDNAAAREAAEQRFGKLSQLLQRLASEERVDVNWRKLCLDTREHVKFLAYEIDGDGQDVNVYEGAAGLSGGERQKLVVFCLAAALRYQLAKPEVKTPSYCLVTLDEAFDKTDPEFTRAGLEVFRQFGFQMLLATPMKMLQVMEDYVGGAVQVFNTQDDDGRSISSLSATSWESDADATPINKTYGAEQVRLL